MPTTSEPVSLTIQNNDRQSILSSYANADANSPLFSQSDSDSDLEPETLIQKYLVLQTRLHALVPPPVTSSKRATTDRSLDPQNFDDGTKSRMSRSISRLTSRLNRIRADVLFDIDEADLQWRMLQIDVARESAERRKLGVSDEVKVSQQNAGVSLRDNDNRCADETESDDTDEMLGEFFTSLPSTDVTDTGKLSTIDSSGKTIEVRDFGRWTGMNPRRVLEEAVRSRSVHLHI